MSRKNFPTRVDPISLARKLRDGLAEADDLLAKNKPQDAQNFGTSSSSKFSSRQKSQNPFTFTSRLSIADKSTNRDGA